MRRPGLLAFALLLSLVGRAGAVSPPASTPVGHLVFSAHGKVVQNRAGDELSLSPAISLLESTPGTVPGVVAVEIGRRKTVVRLEHDATIKTIQTPGRLQLEITARAPATTFAPAAAPMAGQAAGGMLPGLPAPMIAVVDPAGQPVSTSAVPATATSAMAPSAGGAGPAASPVSIAATVLPTTPARPAGLLLPFDRSVGAAAFRRGGRLEVVFDSRKPIDLSASATDPAFQQARLTLLPAGTLLDMPLDSNQPISLARVADGWLLSMKAADSQPIIPEPQTDGLVFKMGGAGEVLTVADPAGGGDLLVGTVRTDTRSVTAAARAPGYRIVPTILGAVVERLSDRVELRPLSIGFRLIDPYPPIGGYRADTNAAFSRSVEMIPVDQAEQWRRYKAFLANSATLPPGSRRASRLDAARSALALGLGREARLLAETADKDAPDATDRAASAFLTGAGALLAGDADAARLLADPLIGNSDEAALWRSLAIGRQMPSDRPAARSVAALWRLMQSYPAPVRQQITGDGALLLARSGDAAARTLVSRLDDATGKAALARALVSEGPDHDAPALGMLDRLAADQDPDVAVSAAMEATELRLRDNLIPPSEAARRMERLIYDGRMAGREQEVALRAAQLDAQASNWPAALAILRQQAATLDADMPDIKRMAGSILLQAAGMTPAGTKGVMAESPLAAISLLDRNQDLLPPDVDRVALSTRLADRLTALDLPGQATVFLRQAYTQAPAGADKARLGVALADSLAQQDDVAGARDVFGAVDRAALSPVMARQAARVDARLRAAAGDRQGAIAALAPLQDQDSVALRARLMADAKDWSGEALALTGLLADRMPNGPGGKPLDPGTEDTVLRLAGALSRSGQHDALRQLDRVWSPLFADRAKRDMVSLLAAPDVTSVGDLPRSAKDIAAARSALHALGNGGAG